MGDNHLVERVQIYPLQTKKKMTMQENEKTRNTIPRSYMKKGMFFNIWPTTWC
jgi:hypothetical protein